MSKETRQSSVSFRETTDAVNYAAAHAGRSPFARYYQSRLYLMDNLLRDIPGGALLDVGCGPGMFVQRLASTRPGDFKITVLDESRAMLDQAAARLGAEGGVEFQEGKAEELPFGDATFDVVVAMGVLEYTNRRAAVSELARVTRPGGLVLVTMLNPLSPYRLFQWCVLWPALRMLARVERLLHVPPERRHVVPRSGIRACPSRRLWRSLRAGGLEPQDLIYYDRTAWVPPLDKVVRRLDRRWIGHPERTVARGARGWLGSAYLIAARRVEQGR